MYFERNYWSDYYGFVSKHIIRIDRDNYSHGRRHGHTHARATNQKDKLNGLKMIRTMLLYRSVSEIPCRIDAIDGSHAQGI